MLRGRLLLLACSVLVLGVVLTALSPAKASAAKSSIQTAVQSYSADGNLQQGMIVGLSKSNANKVVPLTQKNIASMQGVVVPFNAAPVTLTQSSGKVKNQTFVAISGQYDVLVSTQNGPISAGDYITISSVAGVGMKVGASQSLVLGKAAGSFNGSNNVVSTLDLKNSNGKKVSVSVGLIPVNLGIAHNPLEKNASTSYVPSFLQKISNSVANKPVDTARIYLSLLLLLVSAFVAGGLIYSGVKNGMVAVGRNPLARNAITRNLVQIAFLGIFIFTLGLVGVYFLLKL